MSKRKKKSDSAIAILAEASALYAGETSEAEKKAREEALWHAFKPHLKPSKETTLVVKYFKAHTDLAVTLASVMVVKEIIRNRRKAR